MLFLLRFGDENREKTISDELKIIGINEDKNASFKLSALL